MKYNTCHAALSKVRISPAFSKERVPRKRKGRENTSRQDSRSREETLVIVEMVYRRPPYLGLLGWISLELRCQVKEWRVSISLRDIFQLFCPYGILMECFKNRWVAFHARRKQPMIAQYKVHSFIHSM